MSSILDNLAQNNANDWLSGKLNDNPEEDEALKTTARIMTAHIWPFLASSISDDDYRARRGVKEDEVRYMCATVAPHVASALVDYVMDGFDRDFALMVEARFHQAQEEGLAVEELLPWLSGGGGGDKDEDEDQEPGMAETPKIAAVHQAPGGGVHGPYNIEKEDGGYDVVNALGESKGHHDTKGEAREQQKALYVNIPEAREQAEEQHEGALHLAQGDPYGHLTLLPGGKKEDEEEEDNEAPEPIQEEMKHRHTPGLSQTPGVDPQYEDPTAYYGQWGAGGQTQQKAAAAGREAHMGIVIDHYGHISLGARYYPFPHPEAEDPDPDHEISEAESRSPEHDVYHGHEEPPYEADWERPSEEGWHEHGNWRGGAGERNPRTSARGEEKGTIPCPICHKKFEPDDLAEHMRTVHHVSKGEEKDEEYKNRVPGRAKPGQGKAKPSAGRQTHKPSRGQHKAPAKEGQLARSPQRPLEGHWRPGAYEGGYDPSEAFPDYYGVAEGPQRSRTAQAPLAGRSDVPGVGGPGSAPSTPNVATPPVATPESTTGASGMFNPGGGGADFSQSDAPQDIQAQLGQLPALSHKIGAKLAEMAAEAISYNPGLSATAAMELSLQVLRLYPKVAAGGADYMAEPGTEGVPTEVLTECPQCQWQAYNRQINRCHNCGFYDAGLEPSIEVT